MIEPSSAERTTNHATPMLDPGKQRIGWIALRFVGAAIVISAITATVFTQSWTLFFLALLVGVPFILLVSSPVWLARMTGGDAQIHNTND